MSIIAVDLDGTLLNNEKVISIKDKKTIRRISKNHNIVIVSGRSHTDIEKMVSYNKIKKFILPMVICRNGQEIYNVNSKKILYEEYLQFKIIKAMVKTLDENNVYWYCLSNGIAYCRKPKFNCLNYQLNNKFTVKQIKDIDELAKVKVEKFIINEPSNKKMSNIKSIVKKLYDVEFMKYDLEKKYKDVHFMQNIIMKKDINKYTTLIKIKEQLELSDNIFSFGDGFNDYELINGATFGVCMENGNEKIKNIARFITKSNNESGFSYAINYLKECNLLD